MANGPIWEVSIVEFLLVTVVLGGGAAYMTGRAMALGWLENWRLTFYVVLLTLAVRFIHFALFEGTLLSPQFYAVDTVVCLIFGFLGYRLTRVAQMATQYGWINVRSGPFAWTRRQPAAANPGETP